MCPAPFIVLTSAAHGRFAAQLREKTAELADKTKLITVGVIAAPVALLAALPLGAKVATEKIVRKVRGEDGNVDAGVAGASAAGSPAFDDAGDVEGAAACEAACSSADCAACNGSAVLEGVALVTVASMGAACGSAAVDMVHTADGPAAEDVEVGLGGAADGGAAGGEGGDGGDGGDGDGNGEE
eukprot:2370191-Prymnesium_polylepis.1